jgi:hypothetical protein
MRGVEAPAIDHCNVIEPTKSLPLRPPCRKTLVGMAEKYLLLTLAIDPVPSTRSAGAAATLPPQNAPPRVAARLPTSFLLPPAGGPLAAGHR